VTRKISEDDEFAGFSVVAKVLLALSLGLILVAGIFARAWQIMN
jgi:hypothetical protein